jgi:hypothetical protein
VGTQLLRGFCSLIKEGGVEYRSKVTARVVRNGVTPSRLSNEQVTSHMPAGGGIAQEAKALGNARDTLTWAR